MRPFVPGLFAKLFLQCHEQRIRIQPVAVDLYELVVAFFSHLIVLFAETLFCLRQQVQFHVDHLSVVHLRHTEGTAHWQFIGFQQPLFRQQVQIYEIGIARFGAEALVGTVAVTRGPQGQYLPVPLLRLYQKIHKTECCFSQRTDAVFARQRGGM